MIRDGNDITFENADVLQFVTHPTPAGYRVRIGEEWCGLEDRDEDGFLLPSGWGDTEYANAMRHGFVVEVEDETRWRILCDLDGDQERALVTMIARHLDLDLERDADRDRVETILRRLGL
jgi:hypothetical protein